MSNCHLIAVVLFRDAVQRCHSDRKGTGITYLTVTGVNYMLTHTTLWATRTEARTFVSD